MTINVAVGSAISLCRDGLLVSLEVEVDEKTQIAGQQGAAEYSRTLIASAVSEMR